MSEDHQQSYFKQYEETRRIRIVKVKVDVKPCKLKGEWKIIYDEDSVNTSIVSSEAVRLIAQLLHENIIN